MQEFKTLFSYWFFVVVLPYAQQIGAFEGKHGHDCQFQSVIRHGQHYFWFLCIWGYCEWSIFFFFFGGSPCWLWSCLGYDSETGGDQPSMEFGFLMKRIHAGYIGEIPIRARLFKLFLVWWPYRLFLKSWLPEKELTLDLMRIAIDIAFCFVLKCCMACWIFCFLISWSSVLHLFQFRMLGRFLFYWHYSNFIQFDMTV